MKYLNIIKRETKVMIVIVILLLMVVLGVSYALFMQVTDNTNNQVVTTGTLQVEYASSNGYITGDTYNELLPMSNDLGLQQTGYEFSVKNTGNLPVTYNVFMYINYDSYNADKNSGAISGDLFEDLSLINYNLQTNSDANTEISKLSKQTNKEENGIIKYKIYSGSVESNNSINTHKLRIWLDEETDTTNIGKYIYLKLEVASYVSGQEPKICKRATELHEEICNQTDTMYYCSSDGYAQGDTIIYGNETITDGVLNSGDAFDCDVNGDGDYNKDTERFYYVTDMDENTAVLIYYNNIVGNTIDNANTYAYNTNYSDTEYYGPQTAQEQLPTTIDWKNVSLKSVTRNIIDEVDTVRVNNFSYENKAARLLTYQEVESACYDETILITKDGGLSNKCKYLLENTKYSNIESTVDYWLETPRSEDSGHSWGVYGRIRRVGYDTITNSSGVRPVIEVKKSDIEF